MKTFLNVLYRKILYKIPLKLLLILLAIFSVFFACVRADYNGYSFIQTGLDTVYRSISFSRNGVRSVKILTNSQSSGYICINLDYFSSNSTPTISLYKCNSSYNDGTNLSSQSDCSNLGTMNKITSNSDWSENYYCFNNSDTPYLYIDRSSTSSTIYVAHKEYYYNENGISIDGVIGFTAVDIDCPICPDAPTCDYSGYILESDITQNYCVSNGLCPSSDCPIYTGDVQWSSLFINNIQHVGAASIYITIPEEFNWDYDYSGNDNMSIDIEGYNVDYDKIEGIIDTQNYIPTQEDFNNIIGVLAYYMPIIVIFLGLLFIYSMIKKSFKSKL